MGVAEKNVFEIEVPPNKKYLSQIRHFIKGIVKKEHTLPEEKLETLQLCISEAVVNSMAAHKEIASQEPILIKLTLLRNGIDAEIKDKGKGFDIKEFKAKELLKENLEEKGMGLMLMNKLADKCTVVPSLKGTSVKVSIFD